MQLMTMGVSDIKRAGIFVLTFKGWKCGLVPLSLFSLKMPTAGAFAICFSGIEPKKIYDRNW